MNNGKRPSALLALLGVVAAVSFAAGRGDPDAKPGDGKEVLGTWKVVSVRESGHDAPVPGDMGVVITSDTLVIRRGEQDPMGMRYKVDATKRPRQIDWIAEIDP